VKKRYRFEIVFKVGVGIEGVAVRRIFGEGLLFVVFEIGEFEFDVIFEVSEFEIDVVELVHCRENENEKMNERVCCERAQKEVSDGGVLIEK